MHLHSAHIVMQQFVLYEVENSYITTKTSIPYFDVSISSRDLHQFMLKVISYAHIFIITVLLVLKHYGLYVVTRVCRDL